MPRERASSCDELEHRLRALELQLGHALDRGAGEERPVRDEAQARERAWRGCGFGGAVGSAVGAARDGSGACSPIAANGSPS